MLIRLWVIAVFIWICCLASRPAPPFEEHPELYAEITKNTISIVESFEDVKVSDYGKCSADLGNAIETMLDVAYGHKLYDFSIDTECTEEEMSTFERYPESWFADVDIKFGPKNSKRFIVVVNKYNKL